MRAVCQVGDLVLYEEPDGYRMVAAIYLGAVLGRLFYLDRHYFFTLEGLRMKYDIDPTEIIQPLDECHG